MKRFVLPDLGEGLEDAEIISWHVSAGDHVIADQPLLSVETAKAVVEVPSPWSGKIIRLHCKPGDVVKTGAPLADFETEDLEQDRSETVVGKLPSVESTEPAAEIEQTGPEPRRIKASPAVRARAEALGVSLEGVRGSGPGGAVMLEDVENAARGLRSRQGYRPFSGVRRAMALNMNRAREVVRASVTGEADVDHWTPDTDVTIRLVRALIAGCREVPIMNAWFDGQALAILEHELIDLGIAIDTPDGLFAPALRDVANRSDEDLRRGLEAMKRDVAARTVPVEELREQTITLSNFGMFGGRYAELVVVPPQVAILGAGAIRREVRAVNGEAAIRRILPLSVSFDHRAVTGSDAVRFLNAVIAALEA